VCDSGSPALAKVEGGITAARKALRAESSKRDRGETVAADLFALDDEGGDLVELRVAG
jgi:hypothetical protein